MNQKLNLGIIGMGYMGSVHAQNIINGECPYINLVAVSDRNPANITSLKKKYGESIQYFDSADDMLHSGIIDSCLIAVPHYEHTKYAIACMQNGIHVMLEKPAGVYTKQVLEMNAEAEKHPEIVFGMMFNLRTNCIYRKMKELVDSGKYGRIRRTNWIVTDWYRPQAYYDSGKWRGTWSGEGGGVLLNQCPHQLDLWQWICGMPIKVDAHLHFGLWHNIEVEDDVTAYVEYENGATGVFIASSGDGYGTNRFEIQMDAAKLVVENDQLRLWEFEQSEPDFSATNKEPFGLIKVHEINIETNSPNTQHTGVLNAWADTILGNGELIAQGTEGLNGLTLSNAMCLSAFLGRPVDIPFDPDLYYTELMKRVETSKPKC